MTDLSAARGGSFACRASDGIEVMLVRKAERRDGEERDVVCVLDRRDGAYFEIPAEPYLALDVYRLHQVIECAADLRTGRRAGLAAEKRHADRRGNLGNGAPFPCFAQR
ncbi:MAG: hypothetical protein ACXVRV_09945 [Gaiellaceae bacterium]